MLISFANTERGKTHTEPKHSQTNKIYLNVIIKNKKATIVIVLNNIWLFQIIQVNKAV